jgi:putative transposase
LAREFVDEHDLPVSRACDCAGIHRSLYYRIPTHWTVKDAEIVAVLSSLVEGRPNRGFWKCRKMIRRMGHGWNHKRIYRVYKLMELNLRRRAKKRLPKRVRVPLYVPRLPDTVWSADFMSDALAHGRRFRTFNVVDDFNREALHIEIDTSITSQRLVRVFERLQTEHGLPQVLRTDNGPEFLGETFTAWAKDNGMAIQYIQPGKPNQNAYVERFNRTYREELLDQYLFASLDDVREATYWWMLEYNEERPHDSLGDCTPAEARLIARNSTLEMSL